MRLKLCIVLLFVCGDAKWNSVCAQFNLVIDPGFEALDSCPSRIDNIWQTTYWDTLKAGGGGGADICNVCVTPSPPWYYEFSVPNQLESYQMARSGSSYVEFAVFIRDPSNPMDTMTAYRRDYIQTKLAQKLVAGKSYCTKYYVSLWSNCRYTIDELGAYLDDGSVQANYYRPIYGCTPQIKSPAGMFYSDTVNWQPVYGSFIANGTEEYLTIGNFKSEVATNFSVWNNSSTARIIACYYVEDVSVIESNLPAYAGHDTTILQGNSTFIGRPSEIGLECTWYANGIPLQTQDAGFWASPDSTITYIVKQNLCDNIKYDTVVVTVIPNSIKKLKNNNVFELYPNPSNGLFSIKTNTNELVQINVCNVLGEIIFATQSSASNIGVDLSKESKGIYFITVKGKEIKQTKKIIIE